MLKGQVLFRCPECSGPVPSPIVLSRKQGFRQLNDNTTIKKSSNASITQDSGFESLEVPTGQQLSMVSFDEEQEEHGDGDTTTEEIAISFIATPQSVERLGHGQRLEIPAQLQSDTSDDVSFNSFSGDQEKSESTECPKCSHRFCCNCKCTEHPGRPCKEINGDSLLFSDNSHVVTKDSSNLKSMEKAKRSKKDLRRLARV